MLLSLGLTLSTISLSIMKSFCLFYNEHDFLPTHSDLLMHHIGVFVSPRACTTASFALAQAFTIRVILKDASISAVSLACSLKLPFSIHGLYLTC